MISKKTMVNNLIRIFSYRRFSLFASVSTLEKFPTLLNPSSSSSPPPPPLSLLGFPCKPPTFIVSSSSSFASLRFLKTSSSEDIEDGKDDPFRENEERDFRDGWDEGDTTDEWEEEDVTEPKVGDGGDGGGVVLHDVPWGERALSIAHEVLSQFGDDLELFSFKTTPRGYVYVRLDKLSNEYGCPSMEELESYSQEYKKRLDEVGALGEIPDGLALEVSSPGAERLLKVPDDLDRFKDMPMRVCYIEDEESKSNPLEKNGVFLLESLETEACTWKLADVKENRDPLSKGRPLSRKQKDWRLKLPFMMHKSVSFYIEY